MNPNTINTMMGIRQTEIAHTYFGSSIINNQQEYSANGRLLSLEDSKLE